MKRNVTFVATLLALVMTASVANAQKLPKGMSRTVALENVKREVLLKNSQLKFVNQTTITGNITEPIDLQTMSNGDALTKILAPDNAWYAAGEIIYLVRLDQLPEAAAKTATPSAPATSTASLARSNSPQMPQEQMPQQQYPQVPYPQQNVPNVPAQPAPRRPPCSDGAPGCMYYDGVNPPLISYNGGPMAPAAAYRQQYPTATYVGGTGTPTNTYYGGVGYPSGYRNGYNQYGYGSYGQYGRYGFYANCSMPMFQGDADCTHGDIKIDAGDGSFLKKLFVNFGDREAATRGVSIYVDGDYFGPASKHDSGHNDSLRLPVGRHLIQLVNLSESPTVFETTINVNSAYVNKGKPLFVRVDQLVFTRAPFLRAFENEVPQMESAGDILARPPSVHTLPCRPIAGGGCN